MISFYLHQTCFLSFNFCICQKQSSGYPRLLTPFNLLMQTDINFELEKLRAELRHTRGMYAVAQTEVLDASRKVYLGNNDFQFLSFYV